MKTKQKRGASQSKINFLHYIWEQKYYWFTYVILFIIATACSFFDVWFVSQSLAFITLNDFQNAILYLGIGLGAMVLWRVLTYTGNVFYFISTQRIGISIKSFVSKKVLQFDSATFDRIPTGKMVQRINDDTTRWFEGFDCILNYVLDLLYQIVILVYISVLNLYIGLIIICGLIISLIITLIQHKYQTKFDKKRYEAVEENISLITESVRGEKDIKSLKLEPIISKKLDNTIAKQEKSTMRSRLFINSTYNLSFFLAEILTTVMLMVAIFMLRDGVLAMTLFMFLFTNKSVFSNFATKVMNLVSQATSMKVASTRINELFDEKKFAVEKFGTVEIKDFKGKIEFKNVVFSYKPEYEEPEEKDRKKRKKEPLHKEAPKKPTRILNGVSFTIEPNSTVAFVGRSGSGKTTIMNLIAKMLNADSGKVLLDNIDVQELTKDSIRNNIAMVNQFSYIFDMTIRENLLMANQNASEKELWDALDKASLKDFVKGLAKGIDTKVGEGGVKLSGGQRQRLSIARAFLKNSKIILFDESTSSLDNFAQNDIKHSIDSLSGERTVVIVAHRLSTIKNAEKIFFVKDGKINDIGTFDELFGRNEEFRNMFLVEQI